MGGGARGPPAPPLATALKTNMIDHVCKTAMINHDVFIHLFIKFGKLGSHTFASLKRILMPLPISTKFGLINNN